MRVWIEGRVRKFCGRHLSVALNSPPSGSADAEEEESTCAKCMIAFADADELRLHNSKARCRDTIQQKINQLELALEKRLEIFSFDSFSLELAYIRRVLSQGKFTYKRADPRPI